MQGTFADQLRVFAEDSIRTKQALLAQPQVADQFARMCTLVVDSLRAGHRLYVAGNGGSAADSQHIAAELVGRLGKNRPSLSSEALTTDTSALTAIANDYGFDEIFSRQIEGKGRPGDVFLAISTSGKSPNLLRAIERCRAQGVHVIAFAGKDGGPLLAAADVCIVVPSENTNRIQESHILLGHALCACVEAALFPNL